MNTIHEPIAGLITLNDGEDRDAWLAARVGIVTATQAAAIAGSHPYTKLIDVWNEWTDPDYDREVLRNRWLEERAANGNEREPEIIAWASADPLTGGEGNPFIPNKALLANPDRPDFACTPDAYKYARRGVLVLLEAKTTQQDWEHDGLPQHVYDQCQWQLMVTGAVTVWVAVERYRWVGRGANKVPELVGTWMTAVHPDEARLAFLLQEVERFLGWVRDGIAPESDIELAAEPGFDWTPEELADWEAMQTTNALLDELAEAEARVTDDLARIEAIKTLVKAEVKAYDGRRVHLIGTRMIAKLVRFNVAKTDYKALPREITRPFTTWVEQERVVFEPNPEYIAPTAAE